jgi:RNA polymerase sigma-70 factor (ECF subfamily)
MNQPEAREATTESALLEKTPSVVARLAAGHARFLAFLERRVHSREEAEEILQEAFVRALAQGEALRDEESATAWFYRVLRNALVDHHRRGEARKRALNAAAQEPEEPQAGLDAELMRTVCACIGDLVGTLKPEYADAIKRVDLEEQSVADYAERAGVSKNNAGVRLHRARKALLQSVQECCGTCATHGCFDCQCKQ